MAVELEDPFTELCDTFDIDPQVQEEQVKAKVEENHKQVVALADSVSTKQKYDLQDKELIRTELQALIEDNRAVLESLGNQCKVGAAPRLFEVYATLSSTIRDSLRELSEINKTITDYQVIEDREELKREMLELKKTSALSSAAVAQDGGTVNIQNNLNLTSSQMLDILKNLNIPKKETKPEELPKFDLS